MIQTAANLANPIREFLTRHQVLSRLIWLGVMQTAVLVAMELSGYFAERLG